MYNFFCKILCKQFINSMFLGHNFEAYDQRFLPPKITAIYIAEATMRTYPAYSRGKKDTPAYNISPMEMRSL